MIPYIIIALVALFTQKWFRKSWEILQRSCCNISIHPWRVSLVPNRKRPLRLRFRFGDTSRRYVEDVRIYTGHFLEREVLFDDHR